MAIVSVEVQGRALANDAAFGGMPPVAEIAPVSSSGPMRSDFVADAVTSSVTVAWKSPPIVA